MSGAIPSIGAVRLGAWIDAHRMRKEAFDRLWMAVGWGSVTVNRVLAGEVQPDADIGDALAMVTQGAVTVDMFDQPARSAAA